MSTNKRLSIQITAEEHKALLAKMADKNIVSIAQFTRMAIADFKPKKLKKVILKKDQPKKAVKKVAKKASKKVSKKIKK